VTRWANSDRSDHPGPKPIPKRQNGVNLSLAKGITLMWSEAEFSWNYAITVAGCGAFVVAIFGIIALFSGW
jgi:hypothetical protein